MAGKMERKPFDKPDETRPFKNGKGKLEVVTVGDHTIVLAVCSELLSVNKFPDHWENRGNFPDIETIAHAGPRRNQRICEGIP